MFSFYMLDQLDVDLKRQDDDPLTELAFKPDDGVEILETRRPSQILA